MNPPEFLDVDVGHATVGALRWPGIAGARPVVAVHGITSNAWAWDPVAHHLAGGAHLVAVDLRGRGRSHEAGGPFGIRRHADDVAAVIEQLDPGGPVVVAGHSMGAFVALMVATRHPALVADLVLVDGGAPIEIEADADVDEVLETTLGPALERLDKIWVDRSSYLAMWSAHPAFSAGIGVDLERDLLADLVEVDGGFRTAVDVAAVRQDGRELLADTEVRSLLDSIGPPVTILRAPDGLLGSPPPLIGDDVVMQHPRHRWIDVDGTNHYTLLLGPAGARTVADTVRAAIAP